MYAIILFSMSGVVCVLLLCGQKTEDRNTERCGSWGRCEETIPQPLEGLALTPPRRGMLVASLACWGHAQLHFPRANFDTTHAQGHKASSDANPDPKEWGRPPQSEEAC